MISGLLNRNVLPLTILVSFSITFIVCASSDQIHNHKGTTFSLEGTMQYIGIEDGCWQFKSDDGESYEIMGDNTVPLHKNGLRAHIIVREINNVASTCMVGKLVELIEIIETSD